MVLATVFLIIIGVSGGLALASWQRRGTTDNQAQNGPQPVPSASVQDCREETQAVAPSHGARGTLHIALLLRTQTSAIWICRDEAGQLFYHANRGGEAAKWIEGETALFLEGVQQDGDEYKVKSQDGTVFTVTAQRLLIRHKDGRVEIQMAAAG
ncbi:hypothetical protein KRMM14A1259_59680 [Krasilnikovia sp. MM14-A1259]